MTARQMENRVKKLKDIEAQQKALEEQANKLKDELKEALQERGTEEMRAGNYVVRWKPVVSSRFDSKAFQAEHESLYSQYLKSIESRRFTVA